MAESRTTITDGVGSAFAFRGRDRSCVAALAAVALAAIGVQVWLGGPSTTWHHADGAYVDPSYVDLSRPLPVERLPAVQAGFRLDVNRAEWPEWTLLPRIGETLARRIIATRDRVGRFETHDDLLDVSGIGPKTLAQMRPYLLPITPADRSGKRAKLRSPAKH